MFTIRQEINRKIRQNSSFCQKYTPARTSSAVASIALQSFRLLFLTTMTCFFTTSDFFHLNISFYLYIGDA